MIIEDVENVEEVADVYIFERDDIVYRIYPVLYEDKDNFIISYLRRGEDEIYIESAHQKVIAKENIETVYCENILEIGKSTLDNNDDKINKEEKGDNKMTDTIAAALIGAILTGVVTWIVEIILRNNDKMGKESHAASMLYYDLKSIENYLRYERSSVNIRYSTGWQEMISNCTFLTEEEIAHLFKIYDEVYNYNYHYMLKEKERYAVVKEDIASYGTLQKLFLIDVKSEQSKTTQKDKNGIDYSNVITKLKKYLK